MTPEQIQLFKRLIAYASRQAMMRNGQVAQDIRLALNDAARYWHLRDSSDPDLCQFYLASHDRSAKIAGSEIDKQIDTDRANMEALNRATTA